MTDVWRCFVAVPLGDDLRAALSHAVHRWRELPELASLRWTDPNGWHVTLAFLGATDPSTVPGLMASLGFAMRGRVRSIHPTGGVGGFPSTARARVAWYGVDDAGGAVGALASAVRSGLGLPDEARYRPHVTLARARADAVDLRGWAAAAAAPTGTLVVDRVDLMRSHLGRGPALYERLDSLPLSMPAGVGV